MIRGSLQVIRILLSQNKRNFINSKQLIRQQNYLFGNQTTNNQSTMSYIIQKVGQGINYAWEQTFPTEEQSINKKMQFKKQKAKEIKKYTPQELQKIQQKIPQSRRTAMVCIEGSEKTEPKPNVIVNTISSKLKGTFIYSKYQQAQKQYLQFKDDLNYYIGTQEGIAFQAANLAYSKAKEGNTIARAIMKLRQTQPDFDIIEFEPEAGHIFVSNYQNFLKGNIKQLQKQCSEQAFQFLKAHINIYRTKKIKPKYENFWNIEECQIYDAEIQEKNGVTLIFRINVQEIYCFEDLNGNIVEGDQSRLVRSMFEFAIRPGNNGLEDYGHNWQIVQIKKLQQLKMLV